MCRIMYRKLVQEMCDHQDSYKRQVMHSEIVSEYFILVINVHLIIHYQMICVSGPLKGKMNLNLAFN